MAAALARTDIRIPGSTLPLMSVSQTLGVVRRSALTDKPARAESLDVYKVVRRGEIAFNKMSIRAGALGVAPEDGLVTYHYEVMRPRPGHHARFLVYLMKSDWFISELVRRERGIGAGEQANVRTTEVPFRVLKTIDAWLPPWRQQRAIADFLDRETAKIDALIEKQNQLIRLLRERRNQLIWSVVTGLEYAGQADRGPEPWLPRLPEEWGAASIGYDYLVTLGKMLDAGRDAFEDDVLAPYIRAANIQDSGLALEDVNEMPFRPSELMRLDIRKDDLLVVEGGSIGTSYWVPTDIPGWSFQKTVNRVRSRGRGSTRFLGYVLRAYRDRGILALLGDGSTIAHLTAEKLRSLTVPKPPYDMQTQLADYLDRETAKIDSLLVRAEQFIALARERRAALITAAVTGQIEVLGKAS